LQCELESSQTSELRLSQRLEELEATVNRLQAECNSESNAARDRYEDVNESDIIRDLTAENVGTKFIHFLVLAGLL